VQQYGIVDMSNLEMISFAFWEKLTYVSGTTVSLSFFTQQHSDTTGNLPLAGQLPSGFFFIVQAIRFAPFPKTSITADAVHAVGTMAGALDDMLRLLTTSSVKFTVGAKEYGRWPGWMLPAGGGAYGLMSNFGTLAAGDSQLGQVAVSGVPDPRSVYSLPVPLLIPPQYDFKVIAEWAAALTLAVGDTPIYAILDGTLIRPKQ
jgi:hypothetical protein